MLCVIQLCLPFKVQNFILRYHLPGNWEGGFASKYCIVCEVMTVSSSSRSGLGISAISQQVSLQCVSFFKIQSDCNQTIRIVCFSFILHIWEDRFFGSSFPCLQFFFKILFILMLIIMLHSIDTGGLMFVLKYITIDNAVSISIQRC